MFVLDAMFINLSYLWYVYMSSITQRNCWSKLLSYLFQLQLGPHLEPINKLKNNKLNKNKETKKQIHVNKKSNQTNMWMNKYMNKEMK